MKIAELEGILKNHFPVAQIRVAGDGHHFDVVIIDDAFAGLNTLKRQQQVYVAVGDVITDGSLHAINIKAYTPAEWEKSNV